MSAELTEKLHPARFSEMSPLMAAIVGYVLGESFTNPTIAVGGIWGYAEFLEAIADPKHEEHDRMLEWAGDLDPEAFDAEKTTKAMRRGLPDWRQYR